MNSIGEMTICGHPRKEILKNGIARAFRKRGTAHARRMGGDRQCFGVNA